jgi:hypothetical protein
VLVEFGVGGATPVRLDGGRGLTWRARPVVLRPSGDDGETVWKADRMAWEEKPLPSVQTLDRLAALHLVSRWTDAISDRHDAALETVLTHARKANYG